MFKKLALILGVVVGSQGITVTHGRAASIEDILDTPVTHRDEPAVRQKFGAFPTATDSNGRFQIVLRSGLLATEPGPKGFNVASEGLPIRKGIQITKIRSGSKRLSREIASLGD